MYFSRTETRHPPSTTSASRDQDLIQTMTHDLKISELSNHKNESHVRWDQFVNQQGAHPFHLTVFKKIIESAIGCQSIYLYAEDDTGIKAVLPLFEMKSLLFGHALISVPFCVYGGGLGDKQAVKALIEQSILLGEEKKVDYIDLRSQDEPIDMGWSQTLYVYFKKPLCETHEENLSQIPRKQRAVIRKAEQNGLRAVFETNINTFYDLYAASLRNLGTPVLGKSYFETMKSKLRENCEVLTVYHEQTPLTSVMSFLHQDTIFPYYGGGSTQARQWGANDFMYHRLMQSATERGFKQFDFGRSKIDSGSYRFKKHWGFEPKPLHYSIIPICAKKPPNLNPNNPKYQFVIKLWQKMPVSLTKIVGPFIARSLG